MSEVRHRGHRIHYEVVGEGPTVVLQHGMLGDCGSWKRFGYVDALAEDYRVVCVDSLGHGNSDKPTDDPERYALQQRAGDLVAVFDGVGAERVHLVGYSMGGWMASGVAMHHPERLASLTIGGFDVVHGVYRFLPEELRDDPPGVAWLIERARQAAPERVEWITPEVEVALEAVWKSMFRSEGTELAVRALECPVLLWCGTQDPYFAGTKELADAAGVPLIAPEQPHAEAMSAEKDAVVRRLRELFAGTR